MPSVVVLLLSHSLTHSLAHSLGTLENLNNLKANYRLGAVCKLHTNTQHFPLLNISLKLVRILTTIITIASCNIDY